MVWPAVFHGRNEKQPIFPSALSRILTILFMLSFLIDIYIINKWPALKMGPNPSLFPSQVYASALTDVIMI